MSKSDNLPTMKYSHLFLKGRMMRCLSRPKIPKERKPWTEREKENYAFVVKVSFLVSTFNKDTRWYLPIVCYGTEELELEVKSSWIFVEQPPKTTG